MIHTQMHLGLEGCVNQTIAWYAISDVDHHRHPTPIATDDHGEADTALDTSKSAKNLYKFVLPLFMYLNSYVT